MIMDDFPQGFKERYAELLGDEAEAFFATFKQPVQKGFRINPLKANQTLYDTQTTQAVAWGNWGRFGRVKGHSVDHTTGLIYSQEPSAQLVGEIAHPQPDEKVLDLAAAPGGKTTHLASFMNQKGLLVSNEIFKKRAQILSENVERFGAKNVLVTNHAPAELVPKFAGYFDRIVLGAPCSGEGMFRKDPDAMQYWDVDYPSRCAKLQREILVEALKMLKSGGELIYSTCTFAPEEDEQIIAWLLDSYPELELMPIDKPKGVDDGRPEWADGNPELVKTARLFPHHLDGEGHFIAHLRLKEADAVAKKAPEVVKTNLTDSQKEIWQTFADETLQRPLMGTLITFGDQLYLVPTDTPSLKGLRVLRAGLNLGTFKKNRFEPNLALALAEQPEMFKHVYPLDDQQWAQYVHGETFFVDSDIQQVKGWYLLTINGNGTGFGKLVDGQMKNFYPKGLRFMPK